MRDNLADVHKVDDREVLDLLRNGGERLVHLHALGVPVAPTPLPAGSLPPPPPQEGNSSSGKIGRTRTTENFLHAPPLTASRGGVPTDVPTLYKPSFSGFQGNCPPPSKGNRSRVKEPEEENQPEVTKTPPPTLQLELEKKKMTTWLIRGRKRASHRRRKKYKNITVMSALFSKKTPNNPPPLPDT